MPLLLALLSLTACADDNPALTTPDGRVAASPDASPDAAPDAAPDAPSDAAGDARPDASPDASGTADGGPADDGCRVVALGRADLQFNLFGQLTGLRYPVTTALGGAADDVLLLELFDSTTDGLPPLAPGDFDLAAAPDDDLATCQHCVWLNVDEQADGPVSAIYYATRGTLALRQVSDPLEPIFEGGTSRVVLRRARVTDDGHSQLEPGGDCVSIDALAFDTRPTPGKRCLAAEDCGNPLLEICDPVENVCAEPQCGDFFSCPQDGQVCLAQYRDLQAGACYQACDPTVRPAPACGDAQRCVQFGVVPTIGLCRTIGEGAAGAACVVDDTGTACAGDAVCSSVTATCSLSCSFFEEAPGCSGGSVCSLFGVCEPPSIGDPAAIGAACGESASLATGCGADGAAFRGICFGFPGDPLVCEKACLGEDDCTAGEFCAPRFESGLGVCLPLPVCGDGVLGEIDEVCDDGNTEDGDTCSADCQFVEYKTICAAIPTLPLATDVDGDTAAGPDGFRSSCQSGRSRAQLYELVLPGPGLLRLRVASPTDHTISLDDNCEDPEIGEISCMERAAAGETEELVLQVTDAVPAPLTVMVSADDVLQEGPFSLRADFVAQICGDSIIAGNEICDDGNTAGDDGCSSDCLLLEYDASCALAPLLSTTLANTGDTTGANPLFENSCTASASNNGDRLYRYVAPAAGTLHLRLDQAPAGEFNDLALNVLDGCGRPDEVIELACSSVFDVEEVEVPLRAGQLITVVVDGAVHGDAGPYSLEATFTAAVSSGR